MNLRPNQGQVVILVVLGTAGGNENQARPIRPTLRSILPVLVQLVFPKGSPDLVLEDKSSIVIRCDHIEPDGSISLLGLPLDLIRIQSERELEAKVILEGFEEVFG